MATRAGLDLNKVIQAAADLADKNGLHEVTLATLATQLGVRSPTLYHYVGGLPGLHRELALLGCHDLAQRMGKAIMGKSGDEAITALAYVYRSFVNEHPGLYAATTKAADPNDTTLVTAQTEIVEIAMCTLADYHLRDEDAIHVIRMLRSCIHGFATLENEGGFGIPLNIDETFQRLLSIFLSGLTKGVKSFQQPG